MQHSSNLFSEGILFKETFISDSIDRLPSHAEIYKIGFIMSVTSLKVVLYTILISIFITYGVLITILQLFVNMCLLLNVFTQTNLFKN
jgi:hypothetical protein